MGLRVATNVPAQTAVRNLERNSAEAAKSLSRLSSGQRIVNAGDDAAGLSISNKLEAEVRGLKQAARNANDGISLVQTAEGALNETSNLLIRLRELGVQAASDTIGDSERSFLDREMQQLKSEVQRISEVTSYNDRPLLNGSSGEMAFQVGAHAGENQRIVYNTNSNAATVSNLGIGGISVANKDNALDSLQPIDEAITKVSSSRAELGAIQNRLHSAATTAGIHVENLSEARSRIADTDVAEETSNLVKQTILQEAGISVLAQANKMPSNAVRLLM
jgi:flagellin